MDHGFFICALNEDSFEEKAAGLVGRSLSESAFAFEYFGGDLSVSKQRSFPARLAARYLRSRITSNYDTNDLESDSSLPSIAEPVIAQYAQRVLKQLRNE